MSEPRGIWERGGGWVAGQAVLLGAIAVTPPAAFGLPPWPAPLRTIAAAAGLLFGGAGALLALLGMRALGRNLTPLPYPREDGRMVEHGAYRVVRHPIYSGLLLGALGWSLLRGSTPSLLLTLALGVLFDRKAFREEAWLERKYPGYAAYRRRVRKLIPWLY